MSVGIDKTWQNDFTRAVDLENFLTILFQPRIAESVFGFANRNNFAADAQDSTIFDHAKLSEVGAAARSRLAGRRSHSEKLANVGEEQCRVFTHSCSGKKTRTTET